MWYRLHGSVLAGSVADAVPGQWSYTVGPCRGIELGDHLWLSRYLLLRLSEQFRVIAIPTAVLNAIDTYGGAQIFSGSAHI